MTPFEMVRAFHERMGLVIRWEPTASVPVGEVMFRERIMLEELAELISAMYGLPKDSAYHIAEGFRSVVNQALADGPPSGDPDLIRIADGLADVHYVVSGTALHFGIPEDEVLAEVHRSNMSKTPGGGGSTKAVKGEGYSPPDIADVLAWVPGG